MIITFQHLDKTLQADLSKGIDISLPIDAKVPGPNCFYAERPKFEPVRSGDFVGSVKEGGSVNYYKVTFNPHGNGTHTECQGHITEEWEKITDQEIKSHMLAKVITILPRHIDADHVITKEQIAENLTTEAHLDALIIRTHPNDLDKKERDYSGKNPGYIQDEALRYMVECGIQHLLVDLPSVDREEDGGKLSGHKAFWSLPSPGGRKHCTITELIYVEAGIKDGIYLLNLQLSALKLDCTPSRPVLFRITEK